LSVTSQIVESYRHARYIIFTHPLIELQVDRCNGDLKALMLHHKCSRAAFITAYNPYSAILTEHQNQQRLAALSADLATIGLGVMHALGKDTEDKWPAEVSVFVLAIEYQIAVALGKEIWSECHVVGRRRWGT